MPLLGLPEELLVVILELIIPPLYPRIFFPNSRPLLTCRTLHRIGLPILYRTLLIETSSGADLLRRTLLERPTFVRHVRHLYSKVTTLSLLLVLRAIGHAQGSLQTLDFKISAPWVSGRLEGTDEEEPLAAVPVRRLVVRHGRVMFLPHRVSEVASALAEAVKRWPDLEAAEIHPRNLLAPMPDGQPSPLILALSRSPSLQLLRATLPPAWDHSLLIASENPSLKRIVLTKSRLLAGPKGISASYEDLSAASLVAEKDRQPWLMEAQAYNRLMELIVAT